MPTLDHGTLVAALCPPLDPQLTEQLLNEFVSLEKRYVLRDWEPATLDGGQLAEAAARIIYHQDSGNLNPRKDVDACLAYVEDANSSNKHSFPDRRSSIHISKVIRAVYKLRSQRGAVHIDPSYTANHLDSKFVLECSRWTVSEILRIFWKGDRAVVASAIREIVQYDIPVIGEFEGTLLVQRTNCSPEEEILLLLHRVGEKGLTRRELGRFVRRDAGTVTRGLQKLQALREVVKLGSGAMRLTDLGVRRVLTELASKMVL